MGADRRKLQAEVEKLFRRVEEGVEEFETIMKKMLEANSDNQREKFQDDLKKEIKKLQRHRDVIKGWQTGTEVKDKERLAQFRRVIEQRMEQFKEIERENKTKSYSKQGLQIQEKLDPKEQERQETIDWIQLCIEKLSTQWDYLECNMESLEGQGKKKKRVEKETEELRSKLDRFKFHLCQLEVILRLLNNDSLQPAQVLGIKDDLEDYIARNQEEDFIENELIYEDLALGDLAELTQQLGNVTNIGTLEGAENSEDAGAGGSPSPLPGRELEGLTKSEPASQHLADYGDAKGNKHAASHTRSTPTTPVKTGEKNAPRNLSSRPRTATPPPPPEIPYNSVAARGQTFVRNPTPPITTSCATTNENSALVISAHGDNRGVGMSRVETKPIPSRLDAGCVSLSVTHPAPGLPRYLPERLSPDEGFMPQTFMGLRNADLNSSAGTSDMRRFVPPLKMLAELSAQQLDDISHNKKPEVAPIGTKPSGMPIGAAGSSRNSREIRISPALGANPLGNLEDPQTKRDLEQLMAASTRMPLPMDSERQRMYLMRDPVPFPHPYFPTTPPPLSETLEYFSRLQPETLFFVFYYMEGTKAQLLAAKALKKQSWRFHKKHLMWFQRDQEPSIITDEYEQGAYVCFDFEKWSRRRKENFTFEYKFLEDREL